MIEHNERTYDFEVSPGKLVIGDREYWLQSLGPATDAINNVPVTLFFVYVWDGLSTYYEDRGEETHASMTHKGSRVIVSSDWHIVEEEKRLLVQISRHDVDEPSALADADWDRLFMDHEVDNVPETMVE